VQPCFLGEEQDGHRDDACRQTQLTGASQDPRGHYDEGRDFGCGVDVAAARDDICRDDKRQGPGCDNRAESLVSRRDRVAGDSGDRSQQRECANAAETCLGTGGMPGSLPLDANRSAAERPDEHPRDVCKRRRHRGR
jgi:hypothetical protein